jgi:hypothetical protein
MHRSAEGRRVNKGGVRVQACLKKERKKERNEEGLLSLPLRCVASGSLQLVQDPLEHGKIV